MTPGDRRALERFISSQGAVAASSPALVIDRLSIEGDDSYSNILDFTPFFTPITVPTPFPLRYVSLNYLPTAGERIAFAIYTIEVVGPRVNPTLAAGTTNITTDQTTRTIRRLISSPVQVRSAGSGVSSRLTFGWYLPQDLMLYPDKQYYFGIASNDGGQVGGHFYGYQEANDVNLACFYPTAGAIISSIDVWPDSINVQGSLALRPPAFSLLTRQGVLQYLGV